MITQPIQFARKLSDLVKSLATEVAFKDTTAPEIAASIVAFQVGSRIPIPSSPISGISPESFFLETHYEGITATIAEVNTHYPVPITIAANQARGLWLARYSMVHHPNSKPAMNLFVGALYSNKGNSSSPALNTSNTAIHLYQSVRENAYLDAFIDLGQHIED